MPTKDPEKRKAQARAYYAKNKETILARSKAWYEENKHTPNSQETRRKATEKWKAAHRPQYLAAKRAQSKRAYQTNLEIERARGRAKRNRQIAPLQALVDEAKAVGCLLCGEIDATCLDLHHRDPAKKTNSLPRMIRMGKPTEAEVRDEIAKCVVLCANCHRKVHAGSLVLPE